jgi:hypothetical protein
MSGQLSVYYWYTLSLFPIEGYTVNKLYDLNIVCSLKEESSSLKIKKYTFHNTCVSICV